ncbi:LysM domain-containing protein [Saccharothrix luteola]|uniref:LysM domain-containing protein n=1 Tax=Saccharothrix luteola TaxID=2893018 RepID=UPI001E338AA3|nr:LysM domain-containing protein [Saccharothrix luteola]MCC8250475.1 LysM domain-containing protein [Saccharothrix luteola]
MTNPADAMAAAVPQPTPYPRSSRYYGVPTAVHVTADGRQVPHLARRLLPPPPTTAIAEHEVSEGDRPDLLAHRYFGDAEAWWRIADANPVLSPEELTGTPGRLLRIAMPNG